MNRSNQKLLSVLTLTLLMTLSASAPAETMLGQDLSEPPPPLDEETDMSVQKSETTLEISENDRPPEGILPSPPGSNNEGTSPIQIAPEGLKADEKVPLMAPKTGQVLSESAALPLEERQAAIVIPDDPVKRVPLSKLPPAPEVAVILVGDKFYPSLLRLKKGVSTRLIFTTTNKSAGALVIEQNRVQRWISKVGLNFEEQNPEISGSWEYVKEVADARITVVDFVPNDDGYKFHDAVSGAAGEITVEN